MLYSKYFQKRSTYLSALNCPTTVMKNVKIRLILLILTAKISMLKAAKPRIKFLRCYGLHNYISVVRSTIIQNKVLTSLFHSRKLRR